MTASRRFTLELFAPAFPNKGRYVRAHRGTFEENRDFFNPSMISTKEVVLSHPMRTIRRDVEKYARENNARATREVL
jgi:hypothetical protein